MLAREVQQRGHDIIRFQPHGFGAEVAGQVDAVEQLDEVAGADPADGFGRRLDRWRRR
jgi:hypothetical protein